MFAKSDEEFYPLRQIFICLMELTNRKKRGIVVDKTGTKDV